MSYTKGTWKVTRCALSSYVDSAIGGGRLQEVAYCGNCEDGDHEANARLMSAAPELLEALKGWQEALRSSYSDMTHVERAVFDEAEKAISKAEAK